MAFFTVRWQAGTLDNCDLIDRPATGNAASAGSHSCQANAFVVSNNVSKSSAGNVATWTSTRSAVRSHKLVRQMADSSPPERIQPGETTWPV